MTVKTSLRLLVALAIALSPFVAAPAGADDRDVLRDSAARPYVFVFLDNSRTMNFRPPCDDEDIADGKCDAADLCLPAEGCRVPLEGDDPVSKFAIAREALFEVIRTVPDVDFGFATMNQDELRVQNKHWLYTVDATQAGGFFTLSGGVTFPTADSYETFGAPVTCVAGGGDENVGCLHTAADQCPNPASNVCMPADTSDSWELERFRRLPRLGASGTSTTSYYLRVPDGTRYEIVYAPALVPSVYSSTLPLSAQVSVKTCNNTKCSASTLVETRTITYTPVGQFLINDPNVSRTGDTAEAGWLGYSDAVADPTAGCGWEGNEDAAADLYNGYSITWPNLDTADVLDPWADPDRAPANGFPATTAFSSGDTLPFDWLNSNQNQVLEHLGSKRFSPDIDPNDDFGMAPYFANTRAGADDFLRYSTANLRTPIAAENPDLAWALGSFRTWYRGCLNGACPQDIGWDDMAAVLDPRWACRRKFLLVVTDGDIDDDVHCSGPSRNACSLTASMRAQDDVLTFVIALGRENTGQNILNCMSSNGGTGDPIYPKNKADLIAALTEIIGRVREQAAAFASAAVPQVQANVSDKIFLSSFTPLNDTGYWAGRLDAFLKPLPLDDQGLPDRSVDCTASVQSQCFLWDAGDVQPGHLGGAGSYVPERLLLQAPHPDDLAIAPPWDATELQLGTGANERRVIYTQFDQPGNRRLFSYPSTNAEKYDLWDGFGMTGTFIVGDATSEAAANDVANAVIATTLVEKEGLVDVADPTQPDTTIQEPITYLLGDIFHADPVIFGRPTNYNWYTSDPYRNKPLCNAAVDPARQPPTSYRWFADRNFCRRTLLVAPANDGQLHVFDGGIFRNAAGGTFECLLPAKDLDGDGTPEVNEFADSLVDYDLNDNLDGSQSCTSDTDCGGTGPCSGGFCLNIRAGVIDGAYDNGSGREIFAFIPRHMLPTIKFASEPGTDRNTDFWGMDAGVRIDDVFIDPLASEAGSVACLDREWRTVGIGGYREGGPGYYALDLTQPDTLSAVNIPEPTAGYVPSCFNGGGQCGNRPYPAVLWEFLDKESVAVVAGSPQPVRMDEDANGITDLTNSWGKATTGRIRVCTGACAADDTEDRFVAIFGGGVGDSPATLAGNFIYMVDIETGKTIYKEPVVGSVPADVAAIDSNGDTYIDRLYVGTIEGYVYKIELETSPGTPMRLVSQTLSTMVGGVSYNFTAERIQGPSGDENKYQPFQVFSTGGKPIYLEISAVFVAQSNRIALAFGTGNRWNLWDRSGTDGRFYIILDDNYHDANRDGVLDVSCSGCTQPLTEASFTSVDPDSTFDPSNPLFYLYNGGGGDSLRGYYLDLGTNEKVITEAFSLSGVTIFTAFEPTEVVNSDGTCGRSGNSKIFIIGTVTALGYSVPEGGTILDRVRYTEIPQFTTPPFVEQSATANPDSGGGSQHADFMTDALKLIRDELKTLQSTRCKYANYTQNIKTIRSDTGLVFIAPIPVCIDPTSWKEF